MGKKMKIRAGIITGGTSGIGLAIAERMVLEKFGVLIFGRCKNKLANALFKLNSKEIFGMCADVSNFSQCERIFKEFDKRFEGLDFLINNASLPARSILANDPVEIQKVINVNLNGYLYATKLAAERMKSQGHGHIINIGSLSGRTRDADTDLYVAAKSAIDGFTDSIRRQVNPYGVKVTLIEPGSVGTGMITETEQERIKKEEKYLLLKSEDVANAVMFCLKQDERVDITNIALKAHRQMI